MGGARLKMYVILAYIITSTTGQSESDLPCKTDNDCPTQKYCYDTRVCVKCVNCARYKKQQVLCAQSSDDCGSCITGYNFNPADERFDGKPPKFCIKNEVLSLIATSQPHYVSVPVVITNHRKLTSTPAPTINLTKIGRMQPTTIPSVGYSGFNITMIVIGSIITCIVASYGFTIFKRHNQATANKYQRAHACEPVESGNQNPTAPLFQSTDTISYTNEVAPPPYENARHARTIPFIIPNYGARSDPAHDVDSEPEQELDSNAPRQQSEISSVDNSRVSNTATHSGSNDSSTASPNRPTQDNTDSFQNCSQNRQNQTGTKPRVHLTNTNNLSNQQTAIVNTVNVFHINIPGITDQLLKDQETVNRNVPHQENFSNIAYISCNPRQSPENGILVPRDNLSVSVPLLDDEADTEDAASCQELVTKDYFK